MGIRVNIKNFKGQPQPEAYFRVLRITGGSKEEGWHGQVGMYANQAARNAGEQPLFETQLSTGTSNMGPGPGTSGLPTAFDASAPVVVGFNPEPYNAIYMKLKQVYPTAVDTDIPVAPVVEPVSTSYSSSL